MPFSPKLKSSRLSIALITMLTLSSCLVLTTSAQAIQENQAARTMSLSATGTIDSKPDMATLSTGIETVAVSARDALDDNNEVMARMMKSLKNAGLEERDIVTTQFLVQPRYEQIRRRKKVQGPQIPLIIGYTVRNNLQITVRDLDNLGRIMDRLVTLGSNRFGGISFGLSDPDKALDEARAEAMRKVIDKAELYARAAGVRLGAISSISEQSRLSAPRRMAYRAKRSMAMSVPIAAGEHKTSVSVHVSWALEE
ncbi:MAG: SIMPL domain-containing protein [Hyphomicrobiaceae bacterium]|nr:SIMPL domain-containing protein [Hyphomicrobiaceae bacterium]